MQQQLTWRCGRRLLGEGDEKLAFNDAVPGLAGNGGDDAVGGRRKSEHGLHRFQDDHDLASRDRHARFGKDLGHLAGDWRDQAATRVVFVTGCGNRVRQAEAVRFAAMTDDDRFGIARSE